MHHCRRKEWIPAFAVPTNGMHDYVYGAGIALEEIAKRFTGEKTGRIQARTVNLLGVTPLDFGPVSHVEVLKENLKACGWKVLSTWAMGDELDAFLQAGEAEVNLVVSSVGLRAAKVLEEKFGTPYVVGTPIGSYTERIAKALEEKEQIPYLKDRMQGAIEEIMEQKGNRNPASGEEIKKPEAAGRQKKVTLIGEPVTMESLAAGIEQKYGQEHLLSQYEKLSEENKSKLLDEILTLDFNQIEELYKRINQTVDFANSKIEPIGYTDKSAMSDNELKHYEEIGLKAIKEGKLAAVTMAGES